MARILDFKIEQSQTDIEDRLIAISPKPSKHGRTHYPRLKKPKWMLQLRAYKAGKTRTKPKMATAANPK